MISSKLIAARIAYGVDRAVQANATSPVLVKAWELNVAAHQTWLRYVTNWQQKGTSPALDTGGIRDDSFAAVMSVLSPRYTAGFVHGKTASFTVAATRTTIDISNVETSQLSESAIVDAFGDAVSSETFTYASSDITKATVSGTGLVTPVAAGAVTIHVTASSGVLVDKALTIQA